MRTFRLKTILVGIVACTSVCAQNIQIGKAKFRVGDNAAWKARNFNDADWQTVSTVKSWNSQGIKLVRSYAWYRIKFTPRREDFRERISNTA